MPNHDEDFRNQGRRSGLPPEQDPLRQSGSSGSRSGRSPSRPPDGGGRQGPVVLGGRGSSSDWNDPRPQRSATREGLYISQQGTSNPAASSQAEDEMELFDYMLVGIIVFLILVCIGVAVFFLVHIGVVSSFKLEDLQKPIIFLLIYLACVGAGYLWGRHQSKTRASKENAELRVRLDQWQDEANRLQDEANRWQNEATRLGTALKNQPRPVQQTTPGTPGPVRAPEPIQPVQPPPSIYDVSREPADPSDLPDHPHEKIFPPKGERNNLRSGWQVIGASRRGYSHSYEGKYREDDFTIRFFGNSRQGAEVAIVAIADGVSSKEWSRRGALAAVQGATSMPEQRLQTLISLIGKKGGYQQCQQETSNILMEALYAANRSVHECAQRSNVTIDDLQSTLLVFLAVPWDDQRLLVASTQVGDGALFAFQPKKNALPRDKWSWLQHPQIQGAGNEVQPFMRTNIDEWVAAFKCEMVENATCIMGMTDGIADDVEPPRATPEDRQPDPFSRVDDFFQKVISPSFREAQPGEALLNGIAYRKRQSFDDRTVVCLYRL